MTSIGQDQRVRLQCVNFPNGFRSLPVAWLMAFRPDQGIDAVQEAKQEMITAGAEHVRLGPLDRDAVAQLAADISWGRARRRTPTEGRPGPGEPLLSGRVLRSPRRPARRALDLRVATLVDDRLPHRVSDSMRGEARSDDPGRRPRHGRSPLDLEDDSHSMTSQR